MPIAVLTAPIRLWDRLKTKRAIHGYVYRLPRLLRARYGTRETYSAKQIKNAINRSHERHAIDRRRDCHALAIYTNPMEFASYHNAMGVDCDYAAMRATVADAYFHGRDFTVADVFALSPDDGASGGGDGSPVDAGGAGDSGGDGGGGGE